VFHINFCRPSKIENFLFRGSPFVRHLQKSLTSIVFSKLNKFCKIIKELYFAILQQTKSIKIIETFSVYISFACNKQQSARYQLHKTNSVALRQISAAIISNETLLYLLTSVGVELSRHLK